MDEQTWAQQLAQEAERFKRDAEMNQRLAQAAQNHPGNPYANPVSQALAALDNFDE